LSEPPSSRTDQPGAPSIARRGLLLVLSSPSGAGKTTLSRRLLAADAGLRMSVSVTTRKPRPGEVDGRDYRFIDVAEFERLKAAGELLEWAHVHGNLYATPKAPVAAALESGEDVLFDIDWQGAAQVAKARRDDVVLVFILAPSMAELRSRLERRAEDKPDVIQRRLLNARDEIGHWGEYDYVVVNEDLEQSLSAVRAILVAERHKRTRQRGLADFVAKLQAEQ
jgi:guanylate kinase